MNFNNLNFDNIVRFPIEREFTVLNLNYSTLVLSFNMQQQTQSLWCWAATSTSVSKFYSFSSPWTQCKVAKGEMGAACCNTPLPSACNNAWFLDKALDRTHNFLSMQGGRITWNRIKQELQLGKVVGARIGWNGGGGHFMVIHGVTSVLGVEYLHIDDPIYGKSTLTYNQFATNYQGSGSWTHTYFTKKFYYLMWIKDLVIERNLLRPIQNVRPIIGIYEKDFDHTAELKDVDLGAPHYTFNINLNDIKKGMKIADTPTSLRILDIKNNEPIAFYDLGLDESKPELIQMNTDKNYFGLFNETVERIQKRDENNAEIGELKLIKIPALNLEALWLNYAGKTEDIITLIPRFDYQYLKKNTEYSLDEFTKLLIQEKKQLGDLDDTIGG